MNATAFETELRRAAELIQDADSLIVAAGAGMGVDSGLPDFRGTDGFWQAYPALGRERIDFHRIASPKSFVNMPARAWGFYGHRLNLYRRTVPHAGFALLKSWGEKMPHGYSVFTSNVDGHFQKAGFTPYRIHECHGSIHHLQCLDRCHDEFWEADDFIPEVDVETCQLTNAPPSCIHCGGLARPNILMFDDWAWVDTRQERQAASQRAWIESVKRPVVIEIGAGAAIATVRNFSERIARNHGGHLIRINSTNAGVARGQDVRLQLGGLEALQAIDLVLHSI